MNINNDNNKYSSTILVVLANQVFSNKETDTYDRHFYALDYVSGRIIKLISDKSPHYINTKCTVSNEEPICNLSKNDVILLNIKPYNLNSQINFSNNILLQPLTTSYYLYEEDSIETITEKSNILELRTKCRILNMGIADFCTPLRAVLKSRNSKSSTLKAYLINLTNSKMVKHFHKPNVRQLLFNIDQPVYASIIDKKYPFEEGKYFRGIAFVAINKWGNIEILSLFGHNLDEKEKVNLNTRKKTSIDIVPEISNPQNNDIHLDFNSVIDDMQELEYDIDYSDSLLEAYNYNHSNDEILDDVSDDYYNDNHWSGKHTELHDADLDADDEEFCTLINNTLGEKNVQFLEEYQYTVEAFDNPRFAVDFSYKHKY